MMKRIISILCCITLLFGALSLMSCQKENGEGDAETTASGFNADDWTGDVELPEAEATEVPDNYVVPVRKEGETDDSPAIKRALDSIKESGGTIYFCENDYTISEPIIIYKNISYVGRGIGQTTITVKAGANCDAFVTNLFDSYRDQQNYDKLVSAYFGPNSDLPQNFEIKGLTIDGNADFTIDNAVDMTYKATKNTKGSGIKIFGKRYIIENVQVQNFAEIGFYTEFNAPEVTDVDSSYDYFICTKIDGLRVISTGEEGLIYRGPSDQEVDGLWVCASCLTGESTVYADRDGWELASVVFEDKEASNNNTSYCASPELGFAHIWRGYNCWGMVLVGQLRFKADHLIIESTFGGLKTSKDCYSQISILDIHNCMFGDNSRPYFEINSTAHTKISNLEIRYGKDSTQKDMLHINGNNVTIGECQLRGNSDQIGVSKAGGHGVVIKGRWNQISSLNAMRFAGLGSDGKTASAIVIGSDATLNRISGVVSFSAIAATVNNGNNTLDLSTRRDVGQVAVSAGESVMEILDLTLVDYISGGGWTRYPHQVQDVDVFDATTTEVQTVTIAHGCTITPFPANVQLTLLNEDGLTDFAVAYMSVAAVDSTNVTVSFKLSEASDAANAKLGLLVSVN